MANADSVIQRALIHCLEDCSPFSSVLVAYSGGMDSTVLLHALVQLKQKKSFKIKALHVNHQFCADADEWQRHCQHMCAQWGIPLICHRLNQACPKDESLEAFARTQRRAFFRRICQPNEILMKAHHLDDQSETVLLQLFRGAGPRGLSAMSASQRFAQGVIARPFLNIERQVLKQYAQVYQLNWIEDPSNVNLQFKRNYLRHQVLPNLKAQFPGINQCLSRSAAHCAHYEELAQEFSQSHLRTHSKGFSQGFDLNALKGLEGFKQRLVVRHWLIEHQLPLPNTKGLNELLLQMLSAKADAQPSLQIQNVVFKRYQNKLFACQEKELYTHASPLNLTFPSLQRDAFPLQVDWPNGPQYQLVLKKGTGIHYTKLTNYPVSLISRGQETAYSRPMSSRTLKKRFQSLKIPPWKRRRIPLIIAGDQLVALGEYYVEPQWQVTSVDEWGVVVTQRVKTSKTT